MTVDITPTSEIFLQKYKPLIDKYNADKVSQMKSYNPEFYSKCASVIPSDAELDSQSIDPKAFLAELLTDSELKIVNDYTIEDLLSKQVDGSLTAVEIANAYIKSAIIAQLATNCIMQFLISYALEKAAKLDTYLKENGKLVGPMHGIPISLKEHLSFKGEVTHASYVSLLDSISSKHALTVEIFDQQGALYHVRTAQPQTIMHLDTWNMITGRTRNPRSTKLSPGGSSGGESATVGMHGSIMGVGTDIGGSIRCPAAFAGIYGMRPTTKRVSLLNSTPGFGGQESIVPTIGPLARSIEELDYFMEHYINDGKPWESDPTSVPVLWRKVELPTKIKIGVLYTDNLVTPYPSIFRGMRTVVDELKKHSDTFEIVDLTPHWFSEQEMLEIYTTNLVLYTIDGNKGQLSLVEKSGEPILPLTQHFFKFGGGEALSAYQNRQHNEIRDDNQLKIFEEFFKKASSSLGLDFILSPTNVAPAEVPAESFYWGYTSFWNLFDYPNVIFPSGVTHDVELDSGVDEKNLLSNEYEKKVWFKDDGSLRYDAAQFVNAPVGLQLTGKRFDDESVVAAVKKITKVLNVGRQ
ncbi:unnamed protein product [Kluyveromyces dobzhanskii CBS 2104]|uniref:amidase n=1 Tax=Kluyveromyces dobzhanskii CBS 2104 TaxID=1427455 RepID=A0A0A8L6L5_9SACH|nr:unnamed protein product [Kluyveromyces dobzhanskii CBS 2104]